MVEIISKKDGPRIQDLPHRKIIEKNRPVIRGLMNVLTGGALDKSSNTTAANNPQSTKSIHIMDATPPREPGRPVVRISINGRVVIMDDVRARQIMHLGNLRRTAEGDVFFLATSENGFFAPVDPSIAEVLIDLDQKTLTETFTEEALADAITLRLSLDADDSESSGS